MEQPRGGTARGGRAASFSARDRAARPGGNRRIRAADELRGDGVGRAAEQPRDRCAGGDLPAHRQGRLLRRGGRAGELERHG